MAMMYEIEFVKIFFCGWILGLDFGRDDGLAFVQLVKNNS